MFELRKIVDLPARLQKRGDVGADCGGAVCVADLQGIFVVYVEVGDLMDIRALGEQQFQHPDIEGL